MPFQIIRNDITKVKADALVNTANPLPIVGGGTDAAIYHAAGEQQMLAERKKIGEIARGEVAVTAAYNLKAKYVIHTVGPVWNDGNHGELELLAGCYRKSLEKAFELGCKSIAFPMISTGTYGVPKDKALQIALQTIQEFLLGHKMKVTLVVFSAEAYELSGNIFDEIQTFVDENYVEDALTYEYSVYGEDERILLKELEREGIGPNHPEYMHALKRLEQRRRGRTSNSSKSIAHHDVIDENLNVDKLMKNGEKTFQEKLFEIIMKRNVKESYVYNEIHMSRAFFSKLRLDKYYQPTKKTVLAMAVALKLDIYETKDLLERAGLALSRSNKFDVILEACIRNKLYNISDIDLILIKNNLDTLRKYK